MAEQIKQPLKDGRRFGAYVMVVAPEGIVLIEKPGKGRGYELPGGHGEPDDMSLEECAERELLEEVGVHVAPEDMRLIDEPRVLSTHTSGMFLTQINRLPKTLKKIGADGEIVSIMKPRDIKKLRAQFFPPHMRYIDMAFAMLDSASRAGK